MTKSHQRHEADIDFRPLSRSFIQKDLLMLKNKQEKGSNMGLNHLKFKFQIRADCYFKLKRKGKFGG